MLTEDCSVGVRRKRRKQLAAALVGASAMAASAFATRNKNPEQGACNHALEIVQGGAKAPPVIATPTQTPRATPEPEVEPGRIEMGEPAMVETPPRVERQARTGHSVSRTPRRS